MSNQICYGHLSRCNQRQRLRVLCRARAISAGSNRFAVMQDVQISGDVRYVFGQAPEDSDLSSRVHKPSADCWTATADVADVCLLVRNHGSAGVNLSGHPDGRKVI